MKIDNKKIKKIKLGKKAFTLVELIAVIVILSILVTLSVVTFINVRKSALEKEYQNLVSYLETKGIEYARNTSITTISVEDLIKEGFIKPDDDTDIYDPRDNSSMNCKLLKMEFKDDEYVAQLLDNGRDENGKCHEYTKTSEYQICRVDGDNCTLINDDEWFNKDLTLGVMFHGKLLRDTQVKYNWSTNTGYTSNSDIVNTDVKLIGNIIYKCEVTNGDVVGIATKNIRIDKEIPIVSEIKVDTNWSVDKTIEIVASDGNGSGIKGYYIGDVNGECGTYNNSNKVKVDNNGKYKVCVSDKAGNVNSSKVIDVSKIDKDKPSIKAKSSSNTITVGANNNVLSTYFEVKYGVSGGSAKCNYESTKDLAVGNYTLTCTATGGNGLSASASTKLVVEPRIPAVPKVVTKLESANGANYNGAWTAKNVYVGITPGNNSDIISYYQYKINNIWVTPSNMSLSNNEGSFILNANMDSTIVVRACNSKGCGSESQVKTIKIDKVAPTIKAKSTNNEITVGTNNNSIDYFDVKYSISSGSSSCSPSNTGSFEIGTSKIECVVTGGSGLTSRASINLTVLNNAPSVPKVIVKKRNANGGDYKGTWTNNDIYFGLTPGDSNDTITNYQYHFDGDDEWNNIPWLNLNDNGSGSFTYKNEINDTIYIRACNGNSCSDSSTGQPLRIDKTAPEIYCIASNASFVHAGSSRPLTKNSECEVETTFYSRHIVSESTLGTNVFGNDEDLDITVSYVYFDDINGTASPDWRGTYGFCINDYCGCYIIGCATDAAGNTGCATFTYKVKYP